MDPARPTTTKATTSTPHSDSAAKRLPSTNPSSVIDLTMDLFSQYKKPNQEASPRVHSHSPSIKDSASPQRSSSSSLTHNSKQQFSTKVSSEKSAAGSFLKEALLTGATSTPSSSPKVPSLPLAVDNMLNKSMPSPKTNPNTSTIKSPGLISSPSHTSQRSSGSMKVPSNRSSTDSTHYQVRRVEEKDLFTRVDIQTQQAKVSSSHRSSTNTTSSSTTSSSSRRSTTSGIPPGFPLLHEPQVSSNHAQWMSTLSLSRPKLRSDVILSLSL